ncbi:L-glyceraldehyde 3-phosphate reductase [Culturomica massiliensis]|uniref:L-glyceraldehyde 3-phosphate reductase n=1 Tax=Culturomica massiliensis TaxID=1841857 RepID=UPI0026704876|nr:L-glyceraldehyde 3-phosphate reductase [Culturomica massiliensis]
MDTYKASENRYTHMPYRRCGKSGLLLPAISLGLWHNFGHVDTFSNFTEIIHTAFDRGITHFDLANNYGPPPGAAEENFGHILKKSLSHYRDELIISTKAGHDMWPGPYGSWGSRKHLMASIDQSLQRMDIEYVDIFYSHRPDPATPIEETAEALSDIVRRGKALYIGISKYNSEQTDKIVKQLKQAGTPCLIHQDRYSLFDRHIEHDLSDIIRKHELGLIAFSPLAQGLLTNRYLHGIPADSRAAKASGFLQKEQVTEEKIAQARQLDQIARQRGQTLAEMALSWLLKDERVTSVIIGASSVNQLLDNLKATGNLRFSEEELKAIDTILK